MNKKYGNLADHAEILKLLKQIKVLLEEQNDIMLFDDIAGDRIVCCSECDGTCDKDE